MRTADPDRELYLAITERIYLKLFFGTEGRALIESEDLKIVVFDPQAEEVKQWIP